MELTTLIEDCINNKRSAQKEFYLLTADRLMNIARRYTSTLDDAKDVLQNAYVNIYKNLKAFDSNKGNLDAWIAKITINEALQLMRRKERFYIKDNLLKGEMFEVFKVPEILSKLSAEDILEVVQQLPQGYKMIFNLFVVEGYSHKEIGEVLDISESTSRSQLTRAKKMLRNLLIEQNKVELC